MITSFFISDVPQAGSAEERRDKGNCQVSGLPAAGRYTGNFTESLNNCNYVLSQTGASAVDVRINQTLGWQLSISQELCNEVTASYLALRRHKQ